MKIIHIVSSITKINYGVWNAAIFGSEYLLKKYNIQSELWVFSKNPEKDLIPPIAFQYFQKKELTKKGFNEWLEKWNPLETIFVTHGAWLKPSKLGYWAAKKGFKWIYTPHGMFENYITEENGQKVRLGLNKGFNKKWIYFKLVEKPLIRKAKTIRAVSETERKNLEQLLETKIILIYNGIPLEENIEFKKEYGITNIVFLSRLHQKKGIIHLAKAWNETLGNDKRFKLIIGGPDEGELDKISPFFTKNTDYIGPVYGDAKNHLLKQAHYFILPSYSEGFPTSVVEAMGNGAIPLITEGCNFPEVFNLNLGYKIKPNVESVKQTLADLANKNFDPALSRSNIKYINENFTEAKICDQYFQLYQSVLEK